MSGRSWGNGRAGSAGIIPYASAGQRFVCYQWDIGTRTGALPDAGGHIEVHEFPYLQENEVGLFQQKALQAVQIGDTAKMNFPALPGRVFEGEVMSIPAAVGESQFAAGQLSWTSEQRMTRLYPILMTVPEEFPLELRKFGVAASVTIHTEGFGVVGVVADVLQWVGTSLDAVM